MRDTFQYRSHMESLERYSWIECLARYDSTAFIQTFGFAAWRPPASSPAIKDSKLDSHFVGPGARA